MIESCNNLVTKTILMTSSREGCIDLGQLSSGGLLGLGLQGTLLLLPLEVNLRLRPALILQPIDKVLVLPTDVIGKVAHNGVLPSRLEADDAQCRGYDLALHLVVRVGDALEGAKTSDGGLTPSSLLVDHAANCPPDDACGRLEVEGTAGRVGVHALVAELSILGLVTNE